MTSPAKPRASGLGPVPTRPLDRLRTRAELRQLQRFFTHALVRPLTRGDNLAPRWLDGRAMDTVAAEWIKPNDRLTASERLQIYARCYWYRLSDSVYEDCPGLRAALGERKFAALARAYLERYPSRSFTLRNLCERLPHFIAEEPGWTAPLTQFAETVARFEWAQTHAFDAASRPPLQPADFASVPPSRLRLGLQPHLTLLAAGWPVDEYVIAVRRREAQRAEASNTPGGAARVRMGAKVRRPRAKPTFLVVHRYRGRLYYKHVSPPAFAVLSALQAGATLARALGTTGKRVSVDQVQQWFSDWTELGWFCRRVSFPNRTNDVT
jgi:hypothetical protein